MKYAKEIMLPYMNAVASFYEKFVQFSLDGNGNERIKFYPSVSPEVCDKCLCSYLSSKISSCHSLTAPSSLHLNSGIDFKIRFHFSMRSCSKGTSSHNSLTASIFVKNSFKMDKSMAYEKAVSLRKIDAQTGWSLTHMAAVYARFRNGDAAICPQKYLPAIP